MDFRTRRIGITDLELLRYWRNKDRIRNQMHSSQIINSENQKKWFENLDQKLNYSFIYSDNDIDVGFARCEITDLDKLSFETSVHCGNSLYSNHPINFIAIIFIHDYAFQNLNLSLSETTIKGGNKNSININKKLGYKFIKEYDKHFDVYALKKEDYVKSKIKLKKIINYYLNKEDDC